MVEAKNPQSIIFPLAYFPAWKGYVNGKQINIVENKKGIGIQLPIGKSQILLKYESTPVEKIANLISITGIISLIVGIIYFRKKI